jgi:Bacterial protein of unknown function (DUF899)
MPTTRSKALPKVVSQAQWQAAHEKLLVKEKAATRPRDALAAERRRQPMVEITKDYVFDGPKGKARLVDLFAGRRQLILYHFMFAPTVDGWPNAGCPGCSFFVDQIGHLAHLHARNTSLVLVSAHRWPASGATKGVWARACRGFRPLTAISASTLVSPPTKAKPSDSACFSEMETTCIERTSRPSAASKGSVARGRFWT